MFRTAFVFAVVGAASLSSAFPTLQFVGKGEGRNVSISVNDGANYRSVFSGELFVNVAIDNMTNFDVEGFCITPERNMSGGQWSASSGDTSSLGAKGAHMAYLMNKYAPSLFLMSSTNEHKDKAMALQLAIWEIANENTGTLDVTAGKFRAQTTGGTNLNSGQLDLVNGYLSDMGSSVAPVWFSGQNTQGQFHSQDVMTPVPEPATIFALSLGATAFLARRRKRA